MIGRLPEKIPYRLAENPEFSPQKNGPEWDGGGTGQGNPALNRATNRRARPITAGLTARGVGFPAHLRGRLFKCEGHRLPREGNPNRKEAVRGRVSILVH